MNKDRRQRIQKLHDQLEELKGEVEALRDEEQDYFDNMPESFQQGEKGDKAQDAMTALENVIVDIDSALDDLTTAMEG